MSFILPPIGDGMRRQFRDEGWFVLPAAMPTETLEALRTVGSGLMADCEAEMTRRGSDIAGLSQRGRRYFIAGGLQRSAALRDFALSPGMAEICRATLGSAAWFFNDLFIAKAGDGASTFPWHQDGAYVGHPHRPYINCWCPLDDVDERNGTLALLPFSRAGGRELVAHAQVGGDRIGYDGPDPGVLMCVPAGSIVVFASTILHRSGPNQTAQLRRVYSFEYTPEPLRAADGIALLGQAIPLGLR